VTSTRTTLPFYIYLSSLPYEGAFTCATVIIEADEEVTILMQIYCLHLQDRKVSWAGNKWPVI
jgi:hypothetical protein